MMLAVRVSPLLGIQSLSQRPARSSSVREISSALSLALSVKVKDNK